jgi:Flp pilus assembly protein TadD
MTARPGNKFTGKAGFQERREDAMRPNCYLGYDHEALGIYFLEREALKLAEAEFRRAVWLNPFEHRFRIHLAAVLLRTGRKDEARRELDAARTTAEGAMDADNLLRLFEML